MTDSHDAANEPSNGAIQLDGAIPSQTGAVESEVASGAPRPAASSRRLAIAALVVIVGALVSFLGAREVVRSDVRGGERSFHRGSAAVAGNVALALGRQEDASTSAGTYLSRNRAGSSAEFRRWARWAGILRQYPALESLGLIELVRANEVSEFKERRAGLTPTPSTSSTAPTSSAASSATRYECLSAGAVARSAAAATPANFDYCANDPALLGSRDTALSTYAAVSGQRGQGLEVLSPVYRGSVPPKTMAGRRAAFLGWSRTVFAPGVLLARALAGQQVSGARLRRTGTGGALYATGASHAAQTTTASLPGGWSIRTFAAAPAGSVFSDGDALVLLVLGLVASLEAGALALTIGRIRPGAATVAEPVATAPQPREDLYDSLTALPNRGLTLDRAERMLARAGRNSAIMIGALIIDVDWFKDVNEKLGQEAGDQVLKIVAERLEGVVRTHDTVGRYGGDEFVVLVESAVRGMRLDSLARRIIEALHKPFELEGFGPSFCLTASIGVAFGRYATPEDLLRDANMALFAAKAAGKDRYTLFNANMRSVIEGRGVLEVELNTALQDGQFSLLYQPVRDLQSHRIVGMEALLRWEHPTKGEVPPSEFVPLAEESGLIVPIGRWVLEEACARAAAWNVAGHRVGVAVKVSPNQLNRDGFPTDVLRALQQSGLEPSMLALEIAETTVMDDKAAAARRLEELKQLGVKIAIDDFGSGYAYRSDLQSMPIDFLKVDRSSLAASEDEDYRSWLLEAILVFGRDLSLTVVAKGVESQEQLAALQAMGCAMAQGFFVGAPTPAESVPSLLASQAGAPAAPSASALSEPALGDPQSQ